MGGRGGVVVCRKQGAGAVVDLLMVLIVGWFGCKG